MTCLPSKSRQLLVFIAHFGVEELFMIVGQAGLQDALPFVNDIAEQLPSLLDADDVSIPLEMAVFTSLWGNKMDLSLWPSKAVGGKENVCLFFSF